MAFSKKIEEEYSNINALHAEAALFEFISQETESLLIAFEKKHGDVFKKKCDVIAVIIDMYTRKATCSPCKVATISLQNPHEHYVIDPNGKLKSERPNFASKMTSLLIKKGYKIHGKKKNVNRFFPTKLYAVTRVRAGEKLHYHKDRAADKNILPTNRNIKFFDNKTVLHLIEDVNELTARKPKKDEGKFTVFQSGAQPRF